MTHDQLFLFALFAGVFAALLWGRWRYDLIAFSALLIAVVAGLVPAGKAFEGFGHPATLVVALVLVVSAGLTRAGVVMEITRRFVVAGRALGSHIAIMGAVGMALSAFMNNVAALALLMPVDVEAARKAGRPPGQSLMPLSFATILGGMATLIGTPPNIIIATFRGDALGEPFRMFDFAPVGGVVAIVGLLFVALIGWRLIPQRGDATIRAEAKREERERWAVLCKAVEEHLVYNGPCEYADDGDALCDDSECTYCALSKALEAPDAQGE